MTQILDLSKVAAPRPTVRLPQKSNPDGKAYPYAAPSDFGVLELQRALELQGAAAKVGALKKPTPNQKREEMRLLGEVVKLLVPTVEPATLKRLEKSAREQVIFAWFGHYYGDAPDTDAEGEARSRRTTAASSRGSKRSTAGSRQRGSTSRRGR